MTTHAIVDTRPVLTQRPHSFCRQRVTEPTGPPSPDRTDTGAGMSDPHPYGSPELHPKLQPQPGPPVAHTQYSPDGRFWWNGAQWVPAPGAVAPAPVYVMNQDHTGRNVAIGCGIAAGVVILLFILFWIFVIGTLGATSVAIHNSVAAPSANTNCSPSPCASKDGYTLTVGEVQRSVPPDSFIQPPAGLHYVAVTVTLTNNSTIAEPANEFDFQLIDSTGQTRSPSVIAPTATCPAWSLGTLQPGATSGPKTICFEAAGTTSGALTLEWSPGITSPAKLPLP